MAVLDSINVRIVTNAPAAAMAMSKLGGAVQKVGAVSSKVHGPVQLLGETLERFGSEGIVKKAGTSLYLVGSAMELIARKDVGGRANGVLGSTFSWLLRIGSFVIPGGAAIKLLVGGAALIGLTKLLRRGRDVEHSLASMITRYTELNLQGEKLGIATDKLGGLQHAAKLTANMLDGQFNVAMQRQVRRIAEAAHGTGEAVHALQKLNLNAWELSRLSPDQQFLRIADAMQQVATQGERVALTMKLYDTEGVKLVSTLGAGSEKIREMMEEAEKLGIAPSMALTLQAREFGDLVQKVSDKTRALNDRLASSFLWVRRIGVGFKSWSLTIGLFALDKLKQLGQLVGFWTNSPVLAPTAAAVLNSPAIFNSPQLAARTAGTIDTYAASRRNLNNRESPMANVLAVAKEQLKKLDRIATATERQETVPVYSAGG